jgi:hypothetical protein
VSTCRAWTFRHVELLPVFLAGSGRELLGQRCLAVPDPVEREAGSPCIGKILPGHLGLCALLGDIRGALRPDEGQARPQDKRIRPAPVVSQHLVGQRKPARQRRNRSTHRPNDVFAFEVNMDNRPTSDAIPAMPPSSPSSSTPPPPLT